MPERTNLSLLIASIQDILGSEASLAYTAGYKASTPDRRRGEVIFATINKLARESASKAPIKLWHKRA